MRSHRVKFAVVREDPFLELSLLREHGRAREALLVASGGCTALTLAHLLPEIAITAFDTNPAQLEHVRAKADAAARGDVSSLAIEDDDPRSLNQLGAFEGLFRTLRRYVEEFVAEPSEIEAFFQGRDVGAPARWFRSPYWGAAFTVCFNDPFLHTMFGPEATQHAEPGSYPGYFQRVLEAGFAREDAAHNPFLQHIFLGRYRKEDGPPYVNAREPPRALELVLGSLLDVPNLERFDLYSLSNVFDWADDLLVAEWGAALREAARPGSMVLIRQLNNARDVRRFFTPAFEFDDALGDQLLTIDRSLFYERVHVGVRRSPP